MPDRHIHVIAFNIPYPPTYGGVIDVYYKLKAFDEVGIKVHLHCYEYNRKQVKQLESICETLHYYKRNVSKANLFSSKPYIVVSRNSTELITNLQKDNYPILFEGLHTCFFLDDKRLKNRRKVVRMHNIEHLYYLHLARVEKNLFKRYYFFNEAGKLKTYQNILKKADGIAAISKNDTIHLEKRFKNVKTVGPFHPFNYIKIKKGSGTYCLYHANLEIGENNEAAMFLVSKVFAEMAVPLIVTGHKPSSELKEEILKFPHITLVANPDAEQMQKLIRNAHIHILPTFQATGIKLKLYAALFNGRFCITNSTMVKDTGLEQLCIIRDTADDMKMAVLEYIKKPFEQEVIDKRQEVLIKNKFANRYNISQLVKMLFQSI